jgi:ABC-type lipoprotein release transport system permease subunit
MLSKKYINFLSLLLFTYRKKHIAIFIISVVIVALMASVLFISSAIQKDIETTLNAQSDFTIQKYRAGKVLDTPQAWIDEFMEINGVSNVQGRIYGMHFYDHSEQYFMIVGVDLFDTQVVKTLQKLVHNLDIEKFLERDNMIIGSGVKKHFDEYEYKKYYSFRPPDRSIKKVYFYDSFSSEGDIVSSDMIIMDINLAREILGVDDDYVTDIILEVPNPLEFEVIRTKLIVSHFDMRVISKEDIAKHYKNLFNYKGGVFLTLYLVVLLTFLLILYQRYSMISQVDSREIAILRSVGWRIQSVVYLKISENFIVAFSAYLLGIIVAYIYVFILNAPLLKNIFLGYSNLSIDTSFSPIIDIGALAILFLMFVVPFIIAIIIPVWKTAIIEPTEVMR